MKTLILAALALGASLATPTLAHAGCSARTLPVHSGWDRTGTHRGDVTLPSPERATAKHREKVCIIYKRNDRTVYGQWTCDEKDGDRFEYVQNLLLKSSFNDPKMCTYRFTRSTFRAK